MDQSLILTTLKLVFRVGRNVTVISAGLKIVKVKTSPAAKVAMELTVTFLSSTSSTDIIFATKEKLE